ncbi:MAG: hypothetical protein JXQ96_03600 [Cyclobacteriaceae bacterium]
MQNQFTIVVSHFIKEGAEEAFESALKNVIQQAKVYEGHKGIQIIRPANKSEQEYILLIRFDTKANYEVWERSEPRNRWFQELKDYTYKESKIRYEEGIEFWFSMPRENASVPPKKWKMALLTWLVIYPSVLTLSTITAIILPHFPLFLRMLMVSMILVSLMTYLIMPNITKLFAKWIFDKE